MQPATQDQQAQDFVNQADKVLRALVTGGKDSHQLVLDTGLDAVTVAKTIHYFREQLHPPFVETTEINDKFNNKRTIRHYLTEDGRRNLPPPEMPKWNTPDVNPRGENATLSKIKEIVENDKKNSFAALKHVTGMNGKVRIDHDGKIQLGGAKGAVLEAIRNKPKISSNELIEITKLPQGTVWACCAELVKRDIVEIVKDGHANLYREIGAKAEPVSKVHEPVYQEPIKQKPVEAYKPADSLTQAVRDLMDKYEVTDLLLALVSELDTDLKLMKELKSRMQSLTGERK